ncbi:uncharacterized protein FOMMEDRAFT_152468 [Fomitiporia mediterranea MF3/22]|uniref:uncharacterized protein n=1 Tax=Fomitiporia mediterranea (strain MF3/22) TaxID=694068 RepID=UPI0004407BEC|nr:uncharacterized protein FOMMEDRAFT_152468 [Fomitiporia mediterranea MF3/22]EJD07110.1 hypothetical protein FOMMEDRAFT_152468 [Fomitiporia mediterranea MF3/22]
MSWETWPKPILCDTERRIGSPYRRRLCGGLLHRAILKGWLACVPGCIKGTSGSGPLVPLRKWNLTLATRVAEAPAIGVSAPVSVPHLTMWVHICSATSCRHVRRDLRFLNEKMMLLLLLASFSTAELGPSINQRLAAHSFNN